MVKRLGIIVQAHMNSSRLKNKMILNLFGKSVLGHVLSRLQKVNGADELVVATSDLCVDDQIEAECKRYGVSVYRGCEDDVLKRFYDAAKHFHFSDIARVCADNTLVDWDIISKEIEIYCTGQYDLVTENSTVPLGLGCEIFSFFNLQDAYEHANEEHHREHVTPYLYEHTNKIYWYGIDRDLSKYRFTLDTEEDWILIQRIYHDLYARKRDFLLEDVVATMERHPDWGKINCMIQQRPVKD